MSVVFCMVLNLSVVQCFGAFYGSLVHGLSSPVIRGKEHTLYLFLFNLQISRLVIFKVWFGNR